MKPVLFVTGHVAGRPRRRVRAPARARGRSSSRCSAAAPARRPGAGAASCPSLTAGSPSASSAALVASGRYRAVVCPTGGRVALPAAWAGARRARRAVDPVGLAVGAPAHAPPIALSYRDAPALPLRRRGRHLRAARQRLRGRARRAQRARRAAGGGQRFLARARRQGAAGAALARGGADTFLFVGRPEREKGLGVLLEAWRCSGLQSHPSPRSSSSVWDPGPLGSPPAAAAASKADDIVCLDRGRPRAAAQLLRRLATFSSYRRSPPARSASPGGWSSTRR